MKSLANSSSAALVAMLLLLCSANLAPAQIYSVVKAFTGYNGAQPVAGLVFDQAGNLYGTAAEGGTGAGAVYELSPISGGFKQTVLYKFGANGASDGAYPLGSLAFDLNGNLYGTTEHGGTYNGGTVFQLSPGLSGWTETTLHSFGNGSDGLFPTGGVAIDGAGNLFGTTINGGVNTNCAYSGTISSCGTAFELSSKSGGGWTYAVIHNFGHTGDAYFPAGLTLDSSGSLYGQCSLGGQYGKGLVYKLSPGSSGWTETILRQWGNGADGSYPYGTLTFDSAGNLYGTTSQSGVKGNMGTVFELVPNGNQWVEQRQYYFGINTDGQFPFSGIVLDSSLNLYGTTHNGGSQGYGIIYQLTPNSTGWTEKILYNLAGANDGGISSATLVLDASGNLFGTASYGGSAASCITGPVPGCGVVFKVSGVAPVSRH